MIIANGKYGENSIPIKHLGVNRNSLNEIVLREGFTTVASGVHIQKPAGGDFNLNVFKIVQSIMIIGQFAIITEATNLTNMTDVYSDLWDGTNSVNLTKGNPGGMDLSGSQVGSVFVKDLDSSKPYSLSNSNQCRMLEADRRKIGYPFIVTQKAGTDTYIRFNFSTTGSLDFKMDIYFTHRHLDGGSIELV